MASIKDLLIDVGIPLVKEYPSYSVFPTPIRNSHKPSFLVLDNGERWLELAMKDSDGRRYKIGGNILDLLILTGAARSRTEAYDLLESFPNPNSIDIIHTAFMNGTINKGAIISNESLPPIRILKEGIIEDYHLLTRLHCWSVPLSIANRFLSQATIEIGNTIATHDEVLLFRNRSGGAVSFSPYEIRAIGISDITVFSIGGHKVAVFASIFDYLESQQWLVPNEQDVIIYNHYKLLKRVFPDVFIYKWADYYLPKNKVTDEEARLIASSYGDNKSYTIWVKNREDCYEKSNYRIF